MKKEFRAIAMRFNEQNWESIVGKIESAGIEHNVWGSNNQCYLCNNWGTVDDIDVLSIGNCSRRHSNLNKVDKVYEEWDEAVFLEACGIDAEFETFIITREQILQLDKSAKNETNQLVSADLKQWFPKAFEVELKVGSWYRLPTFGRLMFMFSGGFGNDATYGFDFDGNFRDEIGVHRTDINKFVLATDEEVEKALIEEANRRGLKQGIRINDIYNGDRYDDMTTISSNEFDYEPIPFGVLQNKMALRDNDGNILFIDGQWADVMYGPTELTLEQIAEKFGVSVEQIKIKK